MTNTYKKPLVLANEELAEGVYAASGSVAGDCWTLGYTEPQKWNGQWHVFEISAKHTTAVAHMSESLVIKFTFNKNVTAAEAEQNANYTIDGIGTNVLTVTRAHHANGEYHGDDVTFKLFVAITGDQAATEGIAILKEEFVSCGKTTGPNYDFID